MEVKGRVAQLLPMQTGMGKKGPWKKQEFILETPGQYPKKICLSIWGDKVDQYNLAVGELISVAVDLESREYNGRWYTEARAWKVEKAGGAMNGGGGRTQAPSDFGDEPFQQGNASSTDDLPF